MSRAERDFIRSAELGTAVIAEPVVPPAAPLSHRRRWRAAVPNQLFGRLGAASPHLKGWLWRCWYDLLAGRYPQADWTFMNYGFAPTEPTAVLSLARADEANRYPIQLYQHVLRGVDLRGARVLDA